jgi:hypothetical protein
MLWFLRTLVHKGITSALFRAGLNFEVQSYTLVNPSLEKVKDFFVLNDPDGY